MKFNEILFWTEREENEYDETSSKDPLGTESFAGQLAELILPGITSQTWRIRYVTIICLWLDFIENHLKESNSGKSIEHIKSLEKLTAYCLVRFGNSSDRTDRLLGKTYAKAYIEKYEHLNDFTLDKKRYPFLVNHGAAGAYAFYKVLLRSLAYIDASDEFRLTGKGTTLIENIRIPQSSFINRILERKKQNSGSQSFSTLATILDLSTFERNEKSILKADLLSNRRRHATFILLKAFKGELAQGPEISVIGKIAREKATSDDKKDVITVCKYIERFESLNQELHYIFYSLMYEGVDQFNIKDFVRKPHISASMKKITETTLHDYINFHALHENLLGIYDPKPYEFFHVLNSKKKNYSLCVKTLISHHVKNQKRKVKAPWLECIEDKCTIVLRKYRLEKKEIDKIRHEGIHSYRLYNAWRMIRDLGI